LITQEEADYYDVIIVAHLGAEFVHVDSGLHQAI
jgi:hypothetical protein